MAEDDQMIASVLAERLTEDSYVVERVSNGREAVDYARLGGFDVILLDLGLPGLDGLNVLRAVRNGGDQFGDPAIIVMTARGLLSDKIAGLDTGADDYLVKPFAYEELRARLRAVGRRGTANSTVVLRAAGIELDESAVTAKGTSGEVAHLTRREFALLRALMRNAGVVMSRANLESYVYEGEVEIESNAIDFLIRKLRTKLGAETIRNVRGLGWMVPRL